MQGKATKLVYVPLVAAAIMLAQGCAADAGQDAQYAGVCVDRYENRVDDSVCGDYDDQGMVHNSNGSYFLWMPMNSSYAVPSMGQRVPAYIGQRNVAKNTPIAKGVPVQTAGKTPSAIQRGGFGIKSGTTGGTGAKAGSAGS